jgi:hypothetical protein
MKDLILPLSEAHADALYLEPRKYFDEAILGVTSSPDGYHDTWYRDSDINILVYDIDMALEAIMKWQSCCFDDAFEWFCYNTAGSWMGEGTPTFYKDDYDEGDEE